MVGMGEELAVREARELKLHHSVPQVVFMVLDSYSQSIKTLFSCKEVTLEVLMSICLSTCPSLVKLKILVFGRFRKVSGSVHRFPKVPEGS